MIIYQINNPIAISALTSLYQSVGWSGYANNPDIMAKLLPGAFSYISAWDGEKLIGLIRTVGDGCYILYIQDILVHPDYQRQGIGKKLVTQTLEQAKGMRQIILSTDNTEKTIRFYRSLAFVPMTETGAVTFIYRGESK